MTEFAEECNRIPTANLKSAAPSEGRPTKQQAHCYCPKLAKLHGCKAAVILQGIGYKVATSPKVNERDGRKWYFDTLDTLASRWPYIPRNTIDDHIAAQKRLAIS